MSASKQTVPEPMWGWVPGRSPVVETLVVHNGGTQGYYVQAVYLDGVHVGHVVGRRESVMKNAKRWWGYTTGIEEPGPAQWAQILYGTTSRQMAITNLIAAAREQTQ